MQWWDVLGLATFMSWPMFNVLLNNVMPQVLLVRGVFGLVLTPLMLHFMGQIQNHRIILPPGIIISAPFYLTPVIQVGFDLLLSPPTSLSLFVGFGMTVMRAQSGYCLSGRLSIRTSFWLNNMICRWTRQTSVNMVTTESSSPAAEIITALIPPLSVKLQQPSSFESSQLLGLLSLTVPTC